MARKTDGEKIDELEKVVSTLLERFDSIRREAIDRERMAIVEERLNQLKKDIEEAGRRRASFWPPIAGGIVGAILMFLVQLIRDHLK
jgi:hypothetical protein